MKTLEEVKKLARELADVFWNDGVEISYEQLQAFYQRAYEDGRKMQREKDAEICDNLHDTWKFGDGEDSNSGPKECAAAIRNKTGE